MRSLNVFAAAALAAALAGCNQNEAAEGGAAQEQVEVNVPPAAPMPTENVTTPPNETPEGAPVPGDPSQGQVTPGGAAPPAQ